MSVITKVTSINKIWVAKKLYIYMVYTQLVLVIM